MVIWWVTDLSFECSSVSFSDSAGLLRNDGDGSVDMRTLSRASSEGNVCVETVGRRVN
jgi:hypothetical protein